MTSLSAHVSRDMGLLVLGTLVGGLVVHARVRMARIPSTADDFTMATAPRRAAIDVIFGKCFVCLLVAALVSFGKNQFFGEGLVGNLWLLVGKSRVRYFLNEKTLDASDAEAIRLAICKYCSNTDESPN